MKKFLLILLCFPICLSAVQKRVRQQPRYQLDFKLGLAAEYAQDYHTAITYYLKALNQRSDLPDVWNHLADCHELIAKDYLAKADGAYLKALQYAPNHEEALEYQGEHFVLTGQLTKAHRNYRVLKKLNSEKTTQLKEKLDAALHLAKRVLKQYDLSEEE